MSSVRHQFRRFALPLLCCSLPLAGCRSPYVEATVVNTGSSTLRNVEVDYPSASFGTPDLGPRAAFHYRFQLENAGRIKVQFEDSSGKPHSATGPYAKQGQRGTLHVSLGGSGRVLWVANLSPPATAPAGQ